MTPERWDRIRRIYQDALGQDPDERVNFLQKICGQDENLRLEVLHLFQQNELPDRKPEHTRTFEDGQLILNRFRIVRVIGTGGMGEVYEADDQELRERVAVKTIRSNIRRTGTLARFRQEIHLARKVTHPNVCRIFDLFTVGPDAPDGEQRSFLTMELLAGVTLAQKIKKHGALEIQEAASITAQLCEGLAAAHDAGVIHRDFKSGNIMLVPAAGGGLRTVITDFGLARTAERDGDATTGLTQAGAILGTPAYMAPEQLEGRPLSPATDVYALGVVLYEMVTGKLPFASNSPVAAAVQRLKQPPVSPVRVVPALDKRWEAVILKCLEYDPARRYQSARAVWKSLQDAATLTQTESLSRFDVRRLGTAAKTWKLRGGVAALVLVALIIAWMYWRAGPPRPSAEAQRWYAEGTAALREGTYLKAARALERATEIDKNFAVAHARLADAWTELDFADKAKDAMLRASSPELSRDLSVIDKRYVEAVRDTIVRDFLAAIEQYKSILDLLPAAERAYGLVDLGRAYEKAGKIGEAVNQYSAASKLAGEFPASFVHLGILESRQKHSKEAEAAFGRAETLYRAGSNLEGLAEVAYQEGYAASTLGEPAQARSLLDKALQAARAIPSVQLEIRALLQLSAIEYLGGNTEKSSELANTAISLARENGIQYWATSGLVRLGGIYLSAGDYPRAERYLQDALGLAQKNRHTRLEAAARLNLASLRNLEGKPDEVIPLAQAALNYYGKEGFYAESSNALILIVRAKRDKGELREALASALDSLAAAKKAGAPNVLMVAEETVGSLLLTLERYPEALDHFRDALALSRKLGQMVEYQALHCADVLWRLGRYYEAEQLMNEAIQFAKRRPNIMIAADRISANMSLSKNQFDRAVAVVRHALDGKSSPTGSAMAEFKLILGTSELRLGPKRMAQQDCEDARRLASEARDPDLVGRATLALAAVSSSAGSIREASALAESANEFFRSSGRKESEWQSLLVLSRIHRHSGDSSGASQFASKAMDILREFEHNWGTPVYKLYRERPDVHEALQELSLSARK